MKAVDANMVALDFETTGFDGQTSSEPWQLGMVRLRSGRVEVNSCFETLLPAPEPGPLGPDGVREEAPDWGNRFQQLSDQWPELKAWWIGRPLIAHNCATERGVLRRVAPLQQFGPWIDTLHLSRAAYPGLKEYGLGALLDRLKLTSRVEHLCPNRQAHDALYDAVGCGVLLEHILSLPGWSSCEVEHLASIRRGHAYSTSRSGHRRKALQ